MYYQAIKHFHMACAATSGSLFILRGFWMLRDDVIKLSRRWVKILPHVVDTLLLVSACTLIMLSKQYLFVQNWLTAKLLAVIVYIILGVIALTRGRTKTTRVCAFSMALTVFIYIGLVAMTKHPLVFF